MEFISKIARKFAKTAGTALTESVKQEVKSTAINALPLLAGIGLVIIGFKVFKNSSASLPSPTRVPSLSTMSVVTNNFFFGGDFQDEILAKVIAGFEGGKK